MNSLILQTATRFLLLLMLFFSVWVLLRGHNFPGGGFIGGLIAASAFSLYLIAYGIHTFKKLLVIELPLALSIGLIAILISGCIGLFKHKTFLTSVWFFPFSFAIGTPLLFDFGIYLVIISSVLIIIYALEDKI